MKELLNRKWFLLALLMLVLGGGLGAWFTVPRVPTGIKEGMRAPNFSLARLDNGELVSLWDFRGSVVILLFWQSTCPDCRAAMPYFQEMLQQYGTRGLVVLGVDLDHDPEQAREYLEKYNYSLIPLWGSYEEAMKVVELFEVPLVPHSLVIDKKGIIRFKGTFPVLPPEDLIRNLL